jgi:hypothetical protein
VEKGGGKVQQTVVSILVIRFLYTKEWRSLCVNGKQPMQAQMRPTQLPCNLPSAALPLIVLMHILYLQLLCTVHNLST